MGQWGKTREKKFFIQTDATNKGQLHCTVEGVNKFAEIVINGCRMFRFVRQHFN